MSDHIHLLFPMGFSTGRRLPLPMDPGSTPYRKLSVEMVQLICLHIKVSIISFTFPSDLFVSLRVVVASSEARRRRGPIPRPPSLSTSLGALNGWLSKGLGHGSRGFEGG